MRLSRSALTLLFVSILLLPAAQVRADGSTVMLEQRLVDWLFLNPLASYAPESDYGPFVYVDSKGKPLGLSVDFLHLISQKTGLRILAQPAAPLSLNLEKAKQKRVDILTSLRPTPERGEFLQFTTPYVSIPAALFLPTGKDSNTTLAEMSGRRLAVGKGYAVEHFLRENFKQIQWVAVASDAEGMQQMAAGKVDGVVADIASVHFLSTQANAYQSVQAANVGFEYPLSFAFRKDKPELGEILQ
ncbi:MAG: transporter substrate-binding domain-containing protein, partial [Burkholderiales bacterium]|nr:transporter substrate-binding domain-containing protein [Burkholderiales bacterium]